MKFEKHLKNCGILATVFRAKDGDLYIAEGKNGNVLMRCPRGFEPVSASDVKQLPDHIDDILVRGVESLESAELVSATIPKDGRAKDIVRCYADEFNTRFCRIHQNDFSLIERGDKVRIFDPAKDIPETFAEDAEPVENDELEELESDDVIDVYPALVIMDRSGDHVSGIILGTIEE